MSNPLEVLTKRQREIVGLIIAGKTSKEIACDLNITVRTVERTRLDASSRLGVNRPAALARVVMQFEIDRLRKALRPFAAIVPEEKEHDLRKWKLSNGHVYARDFRVAAAVYATPMKWGVSR